MTIRVERKGNKTKVETDYFDSFGTNHSGVYNDNELLGAMKVFGINKLEARVADNIDSSRALHDEFDKRYKEKFGSSQGYFGF
jgi:hypothetical protein